MCGTLGLAFQSAHHHGLDPGVIDGSRRARPWSVVQPIDPVVDKALPPFPTVIGCTPRLRATSLFGIPSAQARMIRAQGEGLSRLGPTCQSLQLRLLCLRQGQLRQPSRHLRPPACGGTLASASESPATESSNRCYDELSTRDTSAQPLAPRPWRLRPSRRTRPSFWPRPSATRLSPSPIATRRWPISPPARWRCFVCGPRDTRQALTAAAATSRWCGNGRSDLGCRTIAPPAAYLGHPN